MFPLWTDEVTHDALCFKSPPCTTTDAGFRTGSCDSVSDDVIHHVLIGRFERRCRSLVCEMFMCRRNTEESLWSTHTHRPRPPAVSSCWWLKPLFSFHTFISCPAASRSSLSLLFKLTVRSGPEDSSQVGLLLSDQVRRAERWRPCRVLGGPVFQTEVPAFSAVMFVCLLFCHFRTVERLK